MIQIQAHRGASAYAPENTMEAFALAIEMGADAIETDVHLTSDAVPVLCHDFSTGRVADQDVRIPAKSFDALCALNFAAHFAGHTPARIPMLADLMDLVRPTNTALNIEIKAGEYIYDGIEAKLLQMAKEFGLEDRIIYSSFNHYCLKTIKAMQPSAQVGLLYQTALYEPWRYANYVGADAIHPLFITLQAPNVVAQCHNHGVKINAWTPDAPEHIQWLCGLGVDGIITNKPDLGKSIRDRMQA